MVAETRTGSPAGTGGRTITFPSYGEGPTDRYWVFATFLAYCLEPLADQQLAGVTMRVPAGLVYSGIRLKLLLAWVRQHETVPVLSGSPTL